MKKEIVKNNDGKNEKTKNKEWQNGYNDDDEKEVNEKERIITIKTRREAKKQWQLKKNTRKKSYNDNDEEGVNEKDEY